MAKTEKVIKANSTLMKKSLFENIYLNMYVQVMETIGRAIKSAP